QRMDPPTAYITPAHADNVTVLKGPQYVVHGAAAPAGVILFERERLRAATREFSGAAALTFGASGREDQTLSTHVANPFGYVDLVATHAKMDDYRDGDDVAVPSRFERCSTQLALGFTPTEHTLIELTGTRSDG